MSSLSGREMFRRIHTKEVALCKWARAAMWFTPNRDRAELPNLAGCVFETGTVPGVEQHSKTFYLGSREIAGSRWFYDIVRAVSVNMEGGRNYWAMSKPANVLIFREQSSQGQAHIGCVELAFKYEKSILHVNPKYTAWKIECKATHAPEDTFNNLLLHWKYRVKTRSASKLLASDYAGSGVRRIVDRSYKTRQSESFLLRDRFLLSHRFTELLWPSVDPRRFSSVGELIQELPVHRDFYQEVVTALRNSF